MSSVEKHGIVSRGIRLWQQSSLQHLLDVTALIVP